jgi:hypothetical protein
MRFVTEDSLVKAVREIRRVLGDEKGSPRFIQTVPGRRLSVHCRSDFAECASASFNDIGADHIGCACRQTASDSILDSDSGARTTRDTLCRYPVLALAKVKVTDPRDSDRF